MSSLICFGFRKTPVPSYDDKQIGAVEVFCQKCGKRYYMTTPHQPCFRCQRDT
jgi:N-acetyl-anhydromuramyl-L-alanine amidase AmpD